MGSASDTAAKFADLSNRAAGIASELEQIRERIALTESVDRHALKGAIQDAHGCRTWCGFLEGRAREAAGES